MATTVVLDMLPAALLETIMTKLDVASLCSLASTCKTLKSCVTRVLTFAPNFHLFVSLSPYFKLILILKGFIGFGFVVIKFDSLFLSECFTVN